MRYRPLLTFPCKSISSPVSEMFNGLCILANSFTSPVQVFLLFLLHPAAHARNNSAMYIWLLPILLSSANWWVHPAFVDLSTLDRPDRGSTDTVRIYAARGEWESAILCVEGGKYGFEGFHITGASIADGIEAPTLRRIAYVQNEGASEAPVPDLLLPVTTYDIPPDTKVAFGLTYYIDPRTRAGCYHGELELESKNRPTSTVPVRIEVFDITLPDVPSLNSLMPLHRPSLQERYGLDNANLDAWKPIYDAIAPYRVSLSVWNGGDLVQVPQIDHVDTQALQEHLAYLTRRAHMACIDLGGFHGCGLQRTPAMPPENRPLKTYLEGMQQWLARKHWEHRAMIMLPTPTTRTAWPATETTAQAIRACKLPLPTLLCAPPYPTFERYTDCWACPLPCFTPEWVQRSYDGLSLQRPRRKIPEKISTNAVSAYMPQYPGTCTDVQDAFDGSSFTAWRSHFPTLDGEAPWIECSFEAPVTLEKLWLLGLSQAQADHIEILTAYPNAVLQKATTSCQYTASPAPYQLSTTQITFRYRNTFTRLRICFAATSPIQLTELLFDANLALPPPTTTRSPWLHIQDDTFPSLRQNAPPLEARLIPWVCFRHDFAGFVYDNFNTWSNDTPTLNPASPGVLSMDAVQSLCYPGSERPLASVRLECLRDGLEDFEYLHLLRKAAAHHAEAAQLLQETLPVAFYPVQPDQTQRRIYLKRVQESRLKIGRFLTQLP